MVVKKKSLVMATLKKQLDGYRLATAEITYYLPDRPILLETYL